MSLRFLLTMVCFLGLLGGSMAAEDAAEPWWLQPHRMLQTNLREIDADMDLDGYIRDIQQLGADVVLFNVGGIVANYPTELEYHYRNPLMNGDLTRDVLDRLHAAGIRMIGRFDFSKINERFAAEHPEWLYVSQSGEYVNYNGQVHTCVSGGYQQEYMLRILAEAVDRYPLDGVFFNMIGYQRSDYSGNQHGICQCENCHRLFREYSGMELPSRQDQSPVYRKYVEFTNMMRDRQFERVNALLKGKRPDLAICTYTATGVDVIRKESNHALSQGTYYDTEQAKWTLLTSGDRQLANAAVHFIAIPYRHSAVSPWLTARRLWQQMAGGAWLDFYCIGPLERQEDRTGLDRVGEIFHFHQSHERWLAPSVPAGQVGLVRRGDAEFSGLLQILAENQIAYEAASCQPEVLERFALVIVPDAGGLTGGEAAALDAYVAGGGKVLLTGQVPAGFAALGALELLEKRPSQQGAYVRIRPEDKDRLAVPVLEKLDLVFLQGEFSAYRTAADVDGLLRLIPADMFGPPEKCYYRQVSEIPALLHCKHGDGAVACFTFGIGAHYQRQAHQGHAALLVGAIDQLLGLDRRLRVSAPPLVEISHRADRQGRFEWLSLYNHSGQRENAMHEPLPIASIEIALEPTKPVRAVRSLATGQELPIRTPAGSRVSVTLPTLAQFDVVVFEYAQ